MTCMLLSKQHLDLKYVYFFVVVVYCVANSSEIIREVKCFTSLPLFVAFYDR